MKKKIFVVIATTISAICMFALSSCSNVDSSCLCTEYDPGYYSASREISPQSFGAKNCSDLELKLKAASGFEFEYSCR